MRTETKTAYEGSAKQNQKTSAFEAKFPLRDRQKAQTPSSPRILEAASIVEGHHNPLAFLHVTNNRIACLGCRSFLQKGLKKIGVNEAKKIAC